MQKPSGRKVAFHAGRTDEATMELEQRDSRRECDVRQPSENFCVVQRCFVDEQYENLRGQVTCPKSHYLLGDDLKSN